MRNQRHRTSMRCQYAEETRVNRFVTSLLLNHSSSPSFYLGTRFRASVDRRKTGTCLFLAQNPSIWVVIDDSASL